MTVQHHGYGKITCSGTHSVTCNPAEVTFPPLHLPKLVLDLATRKGCKAELTWEVFPVKRHLPDIRQLSESSVFQQNARQLIFWSGRLQTSLHSALLPPNNPDLNPVDYKVWSVMQEKVYRGPIKDVDELCSRILTAWDANLISTLLIQQSGSGARVFMRGLKRKADTLYTSWASS